MRITLLLVAFFVSGTTTETNLNELNTLIGTVPNSPNQVRFDVKDDKGAGLDCPSIIPYYPIIDGVRTYYSLYHSDIDGLMNVRLAKSTNLLQWTFVRIIISNADMPDVAIVADTNGTDTEMILVAHEQWMSSVTHDNGRMESISPSRIGFRLWKSAKDLVENVDPINVFVAPIKVGSDTQIEGTPNIYSATVSDDGFVSAYVGLHYLNKVHVDRVANGLVSGIPSQYSLIDNPLWFADGADAFNEQFSSYSTLGIMGNIGQRSAGNFKGISFMLQEANIKPRFNDITIWEAWRVFRVVSPNQSSDSSIEILNIQTPKHSQGIANPKFRVVPCPTWFSENATDCLYVNYFIFSEGAKTCEDGSPMFGFIDGVQHCEKGISNGEAGQLAFFKPIHETLTRRILFGIDAVKAKDAADKSDMVLENIKVLSVAQNAPKTTVLKDVAQSASDSSYDSITITVSAISTPVLTKDMQGAITGDILSGSFSNYVNLINLTLWASLMI
jgi:predicted peroxiredoxin